jgi:hypothetical protein
MSVGGVSGGGKSSGAGGTGRTEAASNRSPEVSKSDKDRVASDARQTSDTTAAAVGQSITASSALDTVATPAKPAEKPGLLESAATWAGQTAKGYATGAANNVLDMANLVNKGANLGLAAVGVESRFQTDMKLEATSPAEQAAQNAIGVASIATGVAGAIKSAPAMAKAVDNAVAFGQNALGLGAKTAPGTATTAGALSSTAKLGDLTTAEAAKIQAAADKLGSDLYVVGSAAKGARRNVGSDLPLAEFGGSKLGTRSDIDYAVKNGLDDAASKLDLPDVDSSWGVRGVDYLSLNNSPAIRFSPGKAPELLTGGGRLNLD